MAKKTIWTLKIKNADGYFPVAKIVPLKSENGQLANIKNKYILEDGREVHSDNVEDLKVGNNLNKSDKEPKTDITPREDAEQHRQDDAVDYVNARNSKFANKGEDIKRSARHQALEWKSLHDLEHSGEAEQAITLKNLMKFEAPDLMPKAPSTAPSALTAYHAVRLFPKTPVLPNFMKSFETLGDDDFVVKDLVQDHNYEGIPRRTSYSFRGNVPDGYQSVKDWTKNDVKKFARQVYTDTYRSIKTKAEELAHSGKHPEAVLGELRNHISEVLKKHRTSGSAVQSFIADMFIPYHNKALHWSNWRSRNNSAQDHLLKFLAAIGPQLGITASPRAQEAVAQYVADPNQPQTDAAKAELLHNKVKEIIGGKNLVGIGLKEKSKAKRFDIKDLYSNMAERIGPDFNMPSTEHHTDYLMNIAKLRGWQYGNSVSDEERKHHLGFAAHALRDLTHILGLPDKLTSINGRLGLAIGARGKGRALAHYEPDLKVINLTRHGGVGSLAHEWFHALDHLMPDMAGKPSNLHASEMPSTTGQYLDSAFGEDKHVAESLHKVRNFLRNDVQRRMRNNWSDDDVHFGISWDKFRDYWLSDKEMIARAFEKYIDKKLKNANRKNTYLAGVSDHPLWPTDEETQKLEPLFDDFFKHFKESKLLHKSLAKGVSQRLGSFNPQDEQFDVTKKLVGDWAHHGIGSRERIMLDAPKNQEMESARKRGIHKLYSQTKWRRNPATKDVEFLLHRGVSREEMQDADRGPNINHREMSSWSPDYDFAHGMALSMKDPDKRQDARHLVLSAWVPSSKIALYVPHFLPEYRRDAYGHEKEYWVKENHNSKAAEPSDLKHIKVSKRW